MLDLILSRRPPLAKRRLTFLRAADFGMSSLKSKLGCVPLQAWSRQAEIAWNRQFPSPGTCKQQMVDTNDTGVSHCCVSLPPKGCRMGQDVRPGRAYTAGTACWLTFRHGSEKQAGAKRECCSPVLKSNRRKQNYRCRGETKNYASV